MLIELTSRASRTHGPAHGPAHADPRADRGERADIGPLAGEPRQGDVLRFITAGSVDDGKSTLIGRLLFDSRAILEDQLAAVETASKKRGMAEADLSLLTDGLEAEREQGITIDVAYRYFATARRKFIIADTPGHVQYTRNMATGASTAHAAVVVADVTKGLLEQGRRHLTIAYLLGIREIIVAVNKMDLAGYDRAAFERVRDDFERFAAGLARDRDPAQRSADLPVHERSADHGFARDLALADAPIRTGGPRLHCIPLSALKGDMVVDRGNDLDWYRGPTLLEQLEALDAGSSVARELPFRFPVQLVQRSPERGRGYLGRIASGSIAVGDRITVLPAGTTSMVRTLHRGLEPVHSAGAGDSIALTLTDELDVSRGDLFAPSVAAESSAAASAPTISREIDATLVWLSTEPLAVGGRYAIKHATRTVKAKIVAVRHVVDITTLDAIEPHAAITANDIVRAGIVVAQPLAFDRYRTNRATGAFIVIDEATHRTVAAGMIE